MILSAFPTTIHAKKSRLLALESGFEEKLDRRAASDYVAQPVGNMVVWSNKGDSPRDFVGNQWRNKYISGVLPS